MNNGASNIAHAVSSQTKGPLPPPPPPPPLHNTDTSSFQTSNDRVIRRTIRGRRSPKQCNNSSGDDRPKNDAVDSQQLDKLAPLIESLNKKNRKDLMVAMNSLGTENDVK